MMRKFFKVLLGIVIVLVVLVVGIIGINRYNSAKYAIPGPDPKDSQAVLAEGVNATYIEGDYLRGFHFPAAGTAQLGTVVVFGGSEGSADTRNAQDLQAQGYNVLALYFFGQPGQKEQLAEVPLDFFDEVLAWIETNANSDEPLTVIGGSKGAELTMNLAARYPEIDNFIAYTPAEYTYQGLAFNGQYQSSFTYQGEPVSFLKFSSDPQVAFTMISRSVLGLPVSYRPTYEKAVETATPDQRDAARIDLKNFRGHGLLFAGDHDAMWQAEIAAKNIAAQYSNVEAVIYPDAGHVFSQDITTFGPIWETMLGGTVEGNRIAKEKSQQVVLDKLNQWHSATAANS